MISNILKHCDCPKRKGRTWQFSRYILLFLPHREDEPRFQEKEQAEDRQPSILASKSFEQVQVILWNANLDFCTNDSNRGHKIYKNQHSLFLKGPCEVPIEVVMR